MDDKLHKLEIICEKHQVKLTSRRRAILELFLQHQDHLRAEDIHTLLKKTGIGFATVYRTLEIFQRIRIIQEVIIDQVKYYELRLFSEKCLHVHFKCEACQEVFDCGDLQLGLNIIGLRDYTEKNYGVEVHDLSIVMIGQCEKCRVHQEQTPKKL